MTSMSWDIRAHTESVVAMLEKMDTALSPVGMASFLSVEVGPYLQMRASNRFANEGDEVSGKWAQLQPATQQIRASRSDWPVGPDHPINKRTGELEAWVTGGAILAMPHALGATLRYPGREPTGELKKKVETAQRGRSKPRTVARPVLGVDATDLLFVTTRLTFYFRKAGSL